MKEEPNEDEELIGRLRQVLGSCSINFLFGAGVNGGAFPFFAQFYDTIEKIKGLGLPGEDGIEAALQKCGDEGKRQDVLRTFVKEFNSKDYKLDHPSLENLGELLAAADGIVSRAENRHPESKRINVFTLNYDRIVEEILEDRGLFNYVLKNETKSFLPFNVIGYNTETRAFIPTFAIYKLHGSVGADRKLSEEGIVFPGQDKLGSVISEFFEMLFAMKGELLRKNAVLFVIGYSWSDDHVNDVISSAIDGGLTVVFPQYKAGDQLPESLSGRVLIVPPGNSGPDGPCDTTKTLASYFKKAML